MWEIGVIGVTGVTAASPQNTESPDDDDHQTPVDEEIGPCIRCDRPADRFTATGKPICSKCVEGASARQEEAPTADGKAGPVSHRHRHR
jgi:hypothetical protein